MPQDEPAQKAPQYRSSQGPQERMTALPYNIPPLKSEGDRTLVLQWVRNCLGASSCSPAYPRLLVKLHRGRADFQLHVRAAPSTIRPTREASRTGRDNHHFHWSSHARDTDPVGNPPAITCKEASWIPLPLPPFVLGEGEGSKSSHPQNIPALASRQAPDSPVPGEAGPDDSTRVQPPPPRPSTSDPTPKLPLSP